MMLTLTYIGYFVILRLKLTYIGHFVIFYMRMKSTYIGGDCEFTVFFLKLTRAPWQGINVRK